MDTFKFESLDIYKSANKIGDVIWELVSKWNFFEKDTMGKQLTRSADSISLNICEGYGRFFYKDKKLFYFYARGSLYETFENLKKAHQRKLVSDTVFNNLKIEIQDLAVRLNNYIKSTGSTISNKKVEEKPTSPNEMELYPENQKN